MKSRLSFAVLVALSVTLPSSAQNNHVDISLKGPWILYVDSSKSFADWPVLIAMAPGVDPKSKWAHQLPIVSNGKAYVLANPTQSYPPKDQIYCLTFDGKCAQKGEGSLDPDDYPNIPLVPAKIPSGQKRWDWVTASKHYYAPTLVLPVPDSYSTLTVWPMRFAHKFDVTGNLYKYSKTENSYSTGVVLHYKKGPAWFDLLTCKNTLPNVSNCNTPANSSGHTKLAGAGALQIEMKAPDTDWSCDPHVRRVYPEMLKLFGNPPSGYAFIDPAHDLDDKGNGVYDEYQNGDVPHDPDPNNPIKSEYCLEHDYQGKYVDARWHPPTSDNKDEEHSMGECDGPGWIDCVQSLILLIGHLSSEDVKNQKLDSHNLDDIKKQASDLTFPRLSQLRRLDDDIALLGQETKEERAPKALQALSSTSTLGTFLNKVDELVESKDPYTKTHGDCGAPAIHLTDN